MNSTSVRANQKKLAQLFSRTRNMKNFIKSICQNVGIRMCETRVSAGRLADQRQCKNYPDGV